MRATVLEQKTKFSPFWRLLLRDESQQFIRQILYFIFVMLAICNTFVPLLWAEIVFDGLIGTSKLIDLFLLSNLNDGTLI